MRYGTYIPLTVLSLIAVRWTGCVLPPSGGCQSDRMYAPRFRSQTAALPSSDPLTMIDQGRDAATATTEPWWMRIMCDSARCTVDDDEPGPARATRQILTVKSVEPVTRLLASANVAHRHEVPSITCTTYKKDRSALYTIEHERVHLPLSPQAHAILLNGGHPCPIQPVHGDDQELSGLQRDKE